MVSSNRFFSVAKKLTLILLIVAIAIPLRYGSTNPKYLIIRLIHSLMSIKHSLTPDQARPTLSAEYRAVESMLRMKPSLIIDTMIHPLEMATKLRSSFPLGTIVPRSSRCQVKKQVYEFEGHKVDTYWINHNAGKEQMNTDDVILYFHGGAYIRGDIHGYSGFECHLSSLFNASLLHLEYRLVPEHPMPAAVGDALALYRALLRDGLSSSRLVIMGDSAGGGLTLLTVQALLAKHLPIPRAVITMSPWTDFSSSGESYTRNRLTDVMISYDSVSWSIEQVLGSDHARLARDDPSYSPLFGSFQGFPPMYITVGTAELVEDDSRQLADKALKAGVDVTLEVGLHMMHVHPILYSYYPEARDTLNNIRQWVETIEQRKND